MVGMHSASLSTKKQAIVTCTDFSKEYAALADSAHELALPVQDQYLAVKTED